MSLILRKKCQEILDDQKLSNYHVAIEESTKCMQIVGECGKPLFSIYGIKFTRMAPTKEEIEYAVELLDTFIIKHKTAITGFLSKIIILKNLVEIKTTDTNRVWINTNHSSGYAKKYFSSYTDDAFKIQINGQDDKIAFDTIETYEKPVKISDYTFSVHRHNAAVKILKAFIVYTEAEEAVEEAKVALSVCDI